MSQVSRHLSFANVASCLALVVALGGTGYAATALPKNSVGSKQIKPAGVKSADLAPGAVTGSTVVDGSLGVADLAPGTLLKGPTGPTGPKGATGTVGAATVQTALATTDVPDGGNASLDVSCLAGQQAIGGGGRVDFDASDANLISSRPAISATNQSAPAAGQSFQSWRITVANPAGGTTTGIRPEIWVVCVATPTS